MDAAEVVIHVMQRDRVLQILQFLGERVSQPSKPAHTHPHRQILALSVAGRNLVVVRISANDRSTRSHALSRVQTDPLADFAVRRTLATRC